MAQNPQDTQQSVSPTGLSDQIEAQRAAENNYDADGFPTNAAGFPNGEVRSKPDNWNDMSDDDKRTFIYEGASTEQTTDFDNNDGTGNPATNPLKTEDAQKYGEQHDTAGLDSEQQDALQTGGEDEAQRHAVARSAGVNTDENAPYEGDGEDGVEMASNEALIVSGKAALFGHGPGTVNRTNQSKKVAPPKGRILRDGEETTFSGTVVGQMAVVDEDVYREVYPFRSKRPSYILVYVKGTAVPLNTLNNLGINTDAAQAESLKAIEDEQADENDSKDK